jgi:NAD(P)H-hydrate epimerase
MRLPARLLHRNPDAHKGDFGHIFILAGSARFSGAAVLCAQAAMRAGAGLVSLGIPEGLNSAIIKIKPKEVMTLPLPETKEGTLSLSAFSRIKDFIRHIDVIALGPGLSQNKSTQGLVRKIVASCAKPMVIDADGLNALAGRLGLLHAAGRLPVCQAGSMHAERILTPHPGEMARLLGISVSQVQRNRKAAAQKLARDYRVIAVLKGRNTIVTDYRVDTYVNKTGNPGMATAGTGDVLTGIIAAFLGQGLDAFGAAKFAVYLHGLAGDLAAKEKTQLSLIASDIIEKIPEAIKISS